MFSLRKTMVLGVGECPGAAKSLPEGIKNARQKTLEKRMPKWSPKGAKMDPKWLPDGTQNGVKKQTEESIANRAPREAPRFAK